MWWCSHDCTGCLSETNYDQIDQYVNRCPYKDDANYSISYISYGYYVYGSGLGCDDETFREQSQPLFFRWEAECDNNYQLTFFQYDLENMTCLFQSTINTDTYRVDDINCYVDECEFKPDGIKYLLLKDYDCSLFTIESSGIMVVNDISSLIIILLGALLALNN